MKDLFYYIRIIQRVAGGKLYLNMSMTLLISLLDGIGMYLIVPLLGMIGLLQMDSGSLPFLAPLTGLIHSWSLQLSLPLVLAVYVLILGGQALLQRSQTLLNARIIQSFIRTLRTETYEGLLRAKWEFYLRKRRSDFNHVMSNELGRVNYGTTLFLQMVTSLIFTVLQIALALWLSPALTVMVLVSGGCLLCSHGGLCAGPSGSGRRPPSCPSIILRESATISAALRISKATGWKRPTSIGSVN